MAEPAAASESNIRRHTDLEIPVEGETVAATRYEPVEVEGPLPALLMYVPYPKDDMITYGGYDPLNRYLSRNGYEVAVAADELAVTVGIEEADDDGPVVQCIAEVEYRVTATFADGGPGTVTVTHETNDGTETAATSSRN